MESDYRKVLEELMKIEIINEARIMGEMNLRKEDLGMEKEEKEQGDIKEIMDNEREEIKEEVKDWHQSICIDSANIEKVKEAAFDNHCPLLEEYDFKVDDPNDTLKPVLNIELNSASGIRPYQVINIYIYIYIHLGAMFIKDVFKWKSTFRDNSFAMWSRKDVGRDNGNGYN